MVIGLTETSRAGIMFSCDEHLSQNKHLLETTRTANLFLSK
jgi:hypothetical protein